MLLHYLTNIDTTKVAAVFTVSCTGVTIRTAECNTNASTDGIFNPSFAVEVCSLWFCSGRVFVMVLQWKCVRYGFAVEVCSL